MLSVDDKLNYPEHPIHVAPVPAHAGQQVPPEALVAHAAWVKGQKEIVGVENSVYSTSSAGTYSNRERVSHMKTRRSLAVSLILVSLRKECDMGKTVNELHVMLKLHEQTLPKKDAPALHAIRAGKGLRGSRKLKPGALSLYVGNGHRVAVEAIGSFHFCLPSGLFVVLYNCHYAPSITRGIISVSYLYDDGFINHFKNNAILVSRNNLVYFCIVPLDGIYEIDLSNSNTNDCSMYVVSNKRAKLNLDSTFLWHSRLGHISKKCIENLQHDVLLNSTDIQSFEMCVSSMSGKMARKPYSHQVERDKDLLGLIHTNNSLITQEASRNFEDLEIIQEEDKHPFVNTSSHHDEDDQEIDEPQIVENGFSKRRLTWMKLYTPITLVLWRMASLKPTRCFAMKDLVKAAYILGIKIYRDKSMRLIGLCQSAYIEKILKRFYMKNSKRRSIPKQDKLKLCKSQGASPPVETDVKNILKYLRNTKNMFLVYRGDIKQELRVSCYTDAGYLTDVDVLKSQTRYVFDLNGGVVDWKSTKQSIFATSYAEAEYIAASDASKEAVWVRKFIFGLGVVPTVKESIKMYDDNIISITIANESGITKGARHYRAKVYYLREVIEFCDVKIEKVHTDDNLADLFIKALPFPKHLVHTKNI
nr:hypothetical protein [Tanacetum cinerariifolium]